MYAQKSKVVVVGGGFAGIRAALKLKDFTKSKVILISDSPNHCYYPDLYYLAGAVMAKENKSGFLSLEAAINIPLKQIFPGPEVELVIDQVRDVNLKENSITLTNQGEINYDYLLMSMGSQTGYFNIPGAEDFSHAFKSSADALNMRNDIEEIVLKGKSKANVVIAGGGFTGVELAGTLSHFLATLQSRYHKAETKLTVIEGSDNLLPGMPEWAQKAALKRLKQLRVEVLLKHLISQVNGEKISCQGGSSQDFDYLIWTTGIQGNNLSGKLSGVQTNKKNQLETNQDLSLKGYPNVFVAGDLAAVQNPGKNQPVPSTAWAAIEEGNLAAENIKRRIDGKDTRASLPQEPIFIVAVGERFAISNFWFFKVSGLVGWVMKRLVTLKYLMSILPFFQAVKLWLKSHLLYIVSEG